MTTGTDQQTMPVGIIGFGWMGRVHAQASSLSAVRPIP